MNNEDNGIIIGMLLAIPIGIIANLLTVQISKYFVDYRKYSNDKKSESIIKRWNFIKKLHFDKFSQVLFALRLIFFYFFVVSIGNISISILVMFGIYGQITSIINIIVLVMVVIAVNRTIKNMIYAENFQEYSKDAVDNLKAIGADVPDEMLENSLNDTPKAP